MSVMMSNVEGAAHAGSALPLDRPHQSAADDRRAGEGMFAATLAAEVSRTTNDSRDEVEASKAEARQAANQLVASAFIIPMLSKLRETSLAEGPFAPGAAEKRFGPLLDEKFADRIVEASNFNIVEAIAERYASVAAGQSRAAEAGRFERISS